MTEKPNGDTPAPAEDPKAEGAGTDTPPKGSSPDPMEELNNQLDREKARAATALTEKDAAEKKARNEKILRIAAEKKLKALTGAGGGDGGGDTPPDNSGTDSSSDAEIERVNAERGVSNLLLMNPQYQGLLNEDQTLKEVLVNNPLSLITEYIDAEDAVEQIKAKLDKRLAAKDEAANKKEEKKGGDVPPTGDNKQELKGDLSADKIKNLSPSEWAKLPKETRDRYLKGEF